MLLRVFQLTDRAKGAWEGHGAVANSYKPEANLRPRANGALPDYYKLHCQQLSLKYALTLGRLRVISQLLPLQVGEELDGSTYALLTLCRVVHLDPAKS